MSYVFFSKYDHEAVRVFKIREHHIKIMKLGRYVTTSSQQQSDLSQEQSGPKSGPKACQQLRAGKIALIGLSAEFLDISILMSI